MSVPLLPPPPPPPPSSWDHLAAILGGVLAVALGAADLFVAGQHLSSVVDAAMIGAGLAALGVKGRLST